MNLFFLKYVSNCFCIFSFLSFLSKIKIIISLKIILLFLFHLQKDIQFQKIIMKLLLIRKLHQKKSYPFPINLYSKIKILCLAKVPLVKIRLYPYLYIFLIKNIFQFPLYDNLKFLVNNFLNFHKCLKKNYLIHL